MKKLYFKKLLSLFLAGTMLVGVGCKDYDDDIDSINKKLDNLETVTVKGLQDQIDAVKKSIPDLTELNQKVAALTTKVDGFGDINAKLAALETTLKTYVDGKVATSEQTLRNELATKAALAELSAKLTALQGKVDAIDVARDIQKAIDDFKKSSWLGDEINKYIAAYKFDYDYVNADGAVGAVVDELKKENSAYKDALMALINSAEAKKWTITKNDLDDELKGYLAKIDELEGRVADLENRIQSLVYIPNSAFFKGIVVGSAPFIVMDDADGEPVNVFVGDAGAQKATLTFVVSPAGIARRITKETLSLMTEKIDMMPTRAGEPVFAVESVTADAATGKITVVATTDYMFGSEENKTLAVAAHIVIANATEGKQGIDFTSEFIPAMYDEWEGEIDPSDLVIAKPVTVDGETTYVEPTADEFASTLVYTDVTTVVSFMQGFSVYYKTADVEPEYIALSTMWANAPTIDVKVPTAVAVASANTANYTLTATTGKIKTSAAVLIGNTITSGDYTYTLKSGANKLEIGKAKQVVTVKVDSKDIVAAPIAMSWIYNAIPASQAYTSDFINLNLNNASKLTAVEFKALSGLTPTYKVLNAENTDVATTIVPVVSIENAPVTDGDSQMIKVKLVGDLQKTASYKVVATYTTVFPNVEITVPVNVTGVPVVAPVVVTKAATYSADSTYYIAVPKYKAAIWNALTADQKKAFGNTQATFETAFAGTFATVTDPKLSKLTIEDGKNAIKGVAVTFGTDTKSGVAQVVTSKITNAWGMEVAYTVNATLTLPVALMAKGDNLTGNDVLGYKLEATPVIDGSTFALTNMSLNFAYFYDKSATGALNADVEYSINEKAADIAAAGASIVGTALNWGTWAQKQGKREINVTAKLKYGSYYLDTKNFTVWYQDPVPAVITVTSVAADKIMGATTTDVTKKIADLLTLNVQDAVDGDTNIFDGTQTNGLEVDLVTALGGKVTYSATGVSGDRVTFDAAKGEIKVAGSADSSFGDPQTVTVTVKYSYNHMTKDAERVAVIAITVKQAEPVVPIL